MAAIGPAALLPALKERDSHVSWDGFNANSLTVKLAHGAEVARISIDARDLVWDFEEVNRAPNLTLFTAAKPGRYHIQFFMNWESGTCESEDVPVTILPSTTKQKRSGL